MIGLFTVFLLPVVGAFLLVSLAPGWMSLGRVNAGELVQPALPAGLESLTVVDGPSWSESVRESPWALVLAGPPDCTKPCEQAIVSMRQARLALGKDAGRVSRWWLVTGMPDARTVDRLRRLDPGLRVGRMGAAANALNEPGGDVMVQLVDPAGYLILRYRERDPARSILRDLKRLLKISKQG